VSSPVVSASCSSCSLTGSHFQHRLRGRASPDSDVVRTDGVGLFARRNNKRWRGLHLRILLVGQLIAAFRAMILASASGRIFLSGHRGIPLKSNCARAGRAGRSWDRGAEHTSRDDCAELSQQFPDWPSSGSRCGFDEGRKAATPARIGIAHAGSLEACDDASLDYRVLVRR
jgi:hypothetical protein